MRSALANTWKSRRRKYRCRRGCGPWQIRDSTQQNLKNRNHGNLTKCLRHLTTVLVDVHITSQGRFSSTASLYHVPLSVMLARQPCRAQVTVYHHSEKVRDFVGVAAPLRRTSKNLKTSHQSLTNPTVVPPVPDRTPQKPEEIPHFSQSPAAVSSYPYLEGMPRHVSP